MEILKKIKNKARNYIARFLSHLYFIKEWDGDVKLPLSDFRLVFFSHFDSTEHVQPYVEHYLKNLIELNCIIIFVSTSSNLSEDSISKLKPYCYKIILRKNIGLDFGSWRMAMDRNKGIISKATGLFLLNDSCFGPVFPMSEMFEKFENSPALSGVTLNYEVTPHLQSYFLYIPKSILKSFFIDVFMPLVTYTKDKNKIIYNYEIGISTLAIKNKIPLNSWVNNHSLIEIKETINPNKNITIWYCDVLLEYKLSPFIKKAVFTNSKKLIEKEQKNLVLLLQKNHPDFSKIIDSYF